MLIIKNCNLIDMEKIYKEKKDILINGNKILEISDFIDESRYENPIIVDAKEKIVTPGLIDANTSLGLREEIYRFTGNDSDENVLDPILPQLRALDGIKIGDEGIYNAMKSGVTSVISGPGNQNLIGGTCVAFKTGGISLDDMIIKEEIAFKINLGNKPKKAYASKDLAPKTRMGVASLIREELSKSKVYYERYKNYREGKLENPPTYNQKLHSLMRVFDGMLVKFTAHQSHDIMTAVRIGKEFGLNYLVEEASEAYLIADQLEQKDIKFIVGPAYGGKREYEIRNRDVIIASILENKNIDFAISTGHPQLDISMCLVQAIMMYKKGLSEEKALRSLTIDAARIIGLEDKIGSIKKGKDADIVIWDGDPLDYYNSTSVVIINGDIIYKKN